MMIKLTRVSDFDRYAVCLGQMREDSPYESYLSDAMLKVSNGAMYLTTYSPDGLKSIIKLATASNWDRELKSTEYMYTPVVYAVDLDKFEVVTTE